MNEKSTNNKPQHGHDTVNQVVRAAVLHPYVREGTKELRTPEAALEEAISLAGAINLKPVMSEIIKINLPSASTFIGSGNVERLRQRFEEEKVTLAIVDHPLSPVQQRNLEQDWRVKVIDRTGLILEIFGERAQTREGQLQVELAALNFQRSRLVRSWTHLERQRGGFGFMGGPGESQLEIDRRLIQERIRKIEDELEKVKQTRSLQRESRTAAEKPVVALVGYTNAGKSTLFNRLTNADVLAKDMLFATLDPVIRPLKLPSNQRAFVSDTVGFISNLPTQLVAAFRATLEEVTEADIILHVRDVASLNSAAEKYDVEITLSELGIDPEGDNRIIEVLNKIDLMTPEDALHVSRDAARARIPSAAISAVTGDGVDGLLNLIDQRLRTRYEVSEFRLPPEAGEALAWLYRNGQVVERRDEADGIHLRVALTEADSGRFKSRFGEGYGRTD